MQYVETHCIQSKDSTRSKGESLSFANWSVASAFAVIELWSEKYFNSPPLKDAWTHQNLIIISGKLDNSGARARLPVAPVTGGRGHLIFSRLTDLQVLFLMTFLHPRFYSSHSWHQTSRALHYMYGWCFMLIVYS